MRDLVRVPYREDHVHVDGLWIKLDVYCADARVRTIHEKSWRNPISSLYKGDARDGIATSRKLLSEAEAQGPPSSHLQHKHGADFRSSEEESACVIECQRPYLVECQLPCRNV